MIEDGKLFCDKCGEEIRIVKDYEPDVEGFMNRIGQDILTEPSQLNTDDPEEEPRRPRLSRVQKWTAVCVTCLSLFLLAVGVMALMRFRSAEYQNARARQYMEKKDFASALSYAGRAAQLEPDNAAYLTDYVVCLAAQGKEQETKESCLKLLKLDPANGAAYKELIPIYEEEGAYQKISDLLLSCPDEKIVNQYPSYIAKPPEFSYAGGIYNELISLKLSANTSGVIYYTMDGTEPDENSQVYASPILLEAGNYQIRAVFVNDYGAVSAQTNEKYYVDVTVPEAPAVQPEKGEYGRPTLIHVDTGENCTVYYTTDGSAPTQDSIQYTGPFPMPVGVTRLRFISYSAAGAASEETGVTYTLNLHAALSIEAARNKLLIELKDAGVIQDMSGSVKTGTGHNVYNYRCAVTIEGTDYYLYREYYEDDAGNRAGTGTDYVVGIMEGQCYKAVQTEQAVSETASREAADSQTDSGSAAQDPWSSLAVQNINSGDTPEETTNTTHE